MPDDLVTVYQSISLHEAEMVHERLTEEGIKSFVDRTASPFDGLTAANQGTHVHVRSDDADRAREIIEKFRAEKAQ